MKEVPQLGRRRKLTSSSSSVLYRVKRLWRSRSVSRCVMGPSGRSDSVGPRATRTRRSQSPQLPTQAVRAGKGATEEAPEDGGSPLRALKGAPAESASAKTVRDPSRSSYRSRPPIGAAPEGTVVPAMTSVPTLPPSPLSGRRKPRPRVGFKPVPCATTVVTVPGHRERTSAPTADREWRLARTLVPGTTISLSPWHTPNEHSPRVARQSARASATCLSLPYTERQSFRFCACCCQRRMPMR